MPASVSRSASSPLKAGSGTRGASSPLKKSTSSQLSRGGKSSSPKAKAKVRENPKERVHHEGHRPPSEWVAAVLKGHNSRRAKHWMPPLVWSDECYAHARFQANACMTAGKKLRPNFIECLSGLHGQCCMGPIKPPLLLNAASAERVLTQWYDEVSKYDFKKPGPQPKARDFTQIVWAGTTSVGMALSSDGRFCVANYFPKGNGHPMDFPKCVQPAHKGPAPWEPQVKESFAVRGACSEENWRKHEETAAGLAAAQALRPATTGGSSLRSAASLTLRPYDLTPSWPRP